MIWKWRGRRWGNSQNKYVENCRYDNLKLLSCLDRVFSQKLSLTFVGNVSINSVGTESVNQTGQAGKTECLVGRPYSQDTCETQLSPYGLTLRISVMCKAHSSFHGMLSHELPAKSLQSSVAWVFILSLSNTQPLQWNSTINTGYKIFNNITIKFGTEYKPTKHNVVNNNFTSLLDHLFVGDKVLKPYEWCHISSLATQKLYCKSAFLHH